MRGRPKGSKDTRPRTTAGRRLYAELTGDNATRAEWSPMAVILYSMRRSFLKARKHEAVAQKLEIEALEAQTHDPDSPETEALVAEAESAEARASEWFDNAVAKAVLVAPYVHPKLVAQPAEPPKVGNPNDLTDEELAQIAQAEADNAATPDIGTLQ